VTRARKYERHRRLPPVADLLRRTIHSMHCETPTPKICSTPCLLIWHVGSRVKSGQPSLNLLTLVCQIVVAWGFIKVQRRSLLLRRG
jgi:hypothetical protein